MRWHFLFFLLINSTYPLVYELCAFYEDLETRCENVTYDFNPIVHSVYTSLAEVQYVAQDTNLTSFASEVHEHVASKIRHAVQSFCTNGDQHEKPVVATDEDFSDVVRPIFEKFHLNNSDNKANAALGRLYSAYLYTNEYLRAIRRQEGIIGFNEVQFTMKHPHLNILNYTYYDITCKPESLQIQAKACIVSASNDNLYLPYVRQDENGIPKPGTHWWSYRDKHNITFHHATLFENAVDKQPEYMLRINDILTFHVSCMDTTNQDTSSILDRRNGYWFSLGYTVTLCSRKNIVATHNYNLKKDCNLFEFNREPNSQRFPLSDYLNGYRNSPMASLNCTVSNRNVTFEELVTWEPFAMQHRLHSQPASWELGQMKMNEISVWTHNQEFEIDHTNTPVDVELNQKEQTELQSIKTYSGTETSFPILFILSVVTNIALICVLIKSKFVELWRLCFKNRDVDVIQLNDVNFGNENFEQETPKH